MAIIKNKPADTIPNIDLSRTERQRFSINNDPNRVIWLNLSDMNIAVRLETYYPQILEVLDTVQKNLSDVPDTDEGLSKLATALTDSDQKLRELIDKLFDAEVSKVCAPEGTMYDLYDGEFRFQHILAALIPLYTTNLDSEMEKMRKKTDKYVKKYHK
jgi:predicted ATPase